MINQEEVSAMLAKEIRELGLNDALKLDMIKEKVMKKIQGMSTDINEMENLSIQKGLTKFPNPDEEQDLEADFKQQTNQVNPAPPQKIGMEAGSEPLGIQMEPKIAIAPEIPDFLKDVEPGKIFVYDFNELSVGGENLSNKPFKTMEDPSIEKSMQQMWSENGITKAEVFQTKFEKIGEVVFDYKSGSSQFIETGAKPDFDIQQQYKENPYASQPEKEIESYIRNNVDLEKVVTDVVTNIVKNYFLTNSERAVAPPQNSSPWPSNPSEPIQLIPSNPNSPVQEGKITLRDLIDRFEKIDTPTELKEAIEGKKNSAKLVYEDKEIKKWILGDKEYYFPSDPMSVRKCYVE